VKQEEKFFWGVFGLTMYHQLVVRYMNRIPVAMAERHPNWYTRAVARAAVRNFRLWSIVLPFLLVVAAINLVFSFVKEEEATETSEEEAKEEHDFGFIRLYRTEG